AVDNELVTFTIVESGDQPPVFDSIGNFAVTELSTLIVPVHAVDPEGTRITLSVNTNLQHYTFSDSGNGYGRLTYNPNLFDAGLDTVRFLASDSGATIRTTTVLSLIVTQELNQPPTFAAAGPFAVEVNDTLIFTITAKDTTDQTISHTLSLSTISLPTNATFTDNGNKTGTFRFMPVQGQAGQYSVTFLATDQGTPQLSGSMPVSITVVNVNQPPILAPIGPRTITEGQTLVINLSATDPDQTMTPYFTANLSNLGGNGTLFDNGNGTAVFTFTPSFVQSGLKFVEFFAHDGIAFDKEVVLIQVFDAGNQSPVFDSVPSPSVVEGDSITVSFTGRDPDGGAVTIEVGIGTPLPTNFTFTYVGNGLARLTVKPNFAQAGNYPLDFTIRDDSNSVTSMSMVVQVTEAGPQTPILNFINDRPVNEGSTLSFLITAFDLDLVPPLLSASPLPGTAVFVDSGNFIGRFTWTPGFYDAGVYPILFTARDASIPTLTDTQTALITVNDVNQIPFLSLPAPTNTIGEGDTLVLLFSAFDPDSTIPKLRVILSGQDTLATNMTFFDSGNGRGTFRFTPNYTQGNGNPTLYSYQVIAIDAADSTITRVSGTRTVQVFNRNQPPVLTFPSGTGPYSVVEGSPLSFSVIAQDFDGIITAFNATGLPSGATFTGTLNSRSFNWTPNFVQAGTYNVTISATDNLGGVSSRIIQINVSEFGNHAPTFTTVLADTVNVFVNILGQYLIRATDLDLNQIQISYDAGPGGVSFIDSGNGTAILFYEPQPIELGSIYTVRFIAQDVPGGLRDTLTTRFRVVNFLRGDADGTLSYTMNDVVYLVRYLYRSGPPPSPLLVGDADSNGLVNVADASYMINFLYRNGPRPPQ
ncbi:MAG: Ig-like domain-containing protein, partial [Candidatus Zixiibacteriota bacterium]